MKAKELKSLAKQFDNFIKLGNDFENVEVKMSEFWFATFFCNNTEREKELIEYWRQK
jgi:hypothetical protein